VCHPLIECTANCSPPQSHDRQALIPKTEGHQRDRTQTQDPTTSLLPRITRLIKHNDALRPQRNSTDSLPLSPSLSSQPSYGSIPLSFLTLGSHWPDSDQKEQKKSSTSLPRLVIQRKQFRQHKHCPSTTVSIPSPLLPNFPK
jgi:hypothetical protein